MKTLKFLSIALSLVLVLASCDKDGAISVVDNTPDFEVVEETVENGEITLALTSMPVGEVALSTFILDGEDFVNNYSLAVQSADLGAAGAIFGGAWGPVEPEMSLQEGEYSDADGAAMTISQDGVDAYDAWVAAGSDPDSEPDLELYLTSYDASGVTYTISNITETTADVEVTGEILDEDGNAIAVSGSFTATLYN